MDCECGDHQLGPCPAIWIECGGLKLVHSPAIFDVSVGFLVWIQSCHIKCE